MSAGPEGYRPLRCLSCEYDIGSLVEQRGRESPGVCPECGEDLHALFRVAAERARRPSWSVRDYLRFVFNAFLHPMRTADALKPSLAVRDASPLVLLNIGVAMLLLIAQYSAIYGSHAVANGTLSDGMSVVFDSVVLVILLAGPLILGYAAAVGFGLWILAEILWLRTTTSVLSAAMSIATVWLMLSPIFLGLKIIASGNYELITHGYFPPPSWYEQCLSALAILPLGIVPVIAFCVVVRLRPRGASGSNPA